MPIDDTAQRAMEFRHLRYFLALAEELHFGRAAQRLAISQPPLSVAIQQLEAAVGARLCDRDSKGVRLTPAGEAFRSHAAALLDRAEEACALAREVQAGEVGRLRLGFVGSTLFNGLSAWLQAFQVAHPRVEVVVVELNSQDQIEALLAGDLDLGHVHTDRLPPALASEPLYTEPFSWPACRPPTGLRASRCWLWGTSATRLSSCFHAKARPTTTPASSTSAASMASTRAFNTKGGTGSPWCRWWRRAWA